MMRRKAMAAIFMGISVIAAGCSGNHGGDMADKNEYIDNYESTENYEDIEDYEYDADNEEEGNDEMREMTEAQVELLCRISMNEDRIREGRLYSWQIEILNQYDYAMEYLARKYPSHSFELVNCEPKNKLNAYTTFYFYEEGDSENRYSLYIDVYEEEEPENRYVARDNFYGELFEDELARRMFELVQEEFPECINVTCNITCVQGEEFGENLDLEQVLTGELEMDHDTDFYIDAEGMNVNYPSEWLSITLK